MIEIQRFRPRRQMLLPEGSPPLQRLITFRGLSLGAHASDIRPISGGTVSEERSAFNSIKSVTNFFSFVKGGNRT
jgi:hypothetical protein